MCVARGDVEKLLHLVLLWLDIGTRPILKQKDELRLIINQQIISQPIIENCTQNIGRLLVAGTLSLYVLELTLGWFLLCLVYDTAVGDGKLFVFWNLDYQSFIARDLDVVWIKIVEESFVNCAKIVFIGVKSVKLFAGTDIPNNHNILNFERSTYLSSINWPINIWNLSFTYSFIFWLQFENLI